MKTILVVDDEYVALDALSMLLEGEGFRVRRASDGLEAWQRIDEEIPNVVISDVQMPLMGGAELSRRIAGDPRCAEVRLILMLEPFASAPAQLANRATLIVKPIRFTDLLDQLAALGIRAEP